MHRGFGFWRFVIGVLSRDRFTLLVYFMLVNTPAYHGREGRKFWIKICIKSVKRAVGMCRFCVLCNIDTISASWVTLRKSRQLGCQEVIEGSASVEQE